VVVALQAFGLVPLGLLAVPTFLMGWTYAFIQRTVQTDVRHVGWRVGLIQTANIAGSILGSLLTGAVLLEVLGTPATIRLLLVVGSLFGVLAVRRSPTRRPAATRGVVVVSLLLALSIPSSDRFWARFHGADAADVVVAEDASSMVALHRLNARVAVLRVNGTGHSLVPFGGAHTILGVLPGLLHPDAKDFLIIGLGTGNTAWAAGGSPAAEHIDVYEIARPEYAVMQQYQDRWFPVPPVQQLHEDPRVRMRFADGRLALRVEQRRYDVIEIDALEAHMAYSGNLYSREFFELARRGLRPGGIFCSYTPTQRTRRTLVSVFPYVLLVKAPMNPSIMIGSNEPIRFDRQAILERFESDRVRAYFRESRRLRRVTRELSDYLEQTTVTEIGPEQRAAYLRGGDINTDLFPRDEFDKSIPMSE
jgi:SAM-dependent methyltransferase